MFKRLISVLLVMALFLSMPYVGAEETTNENLVVEESETEKSETNNVVSTNEIIDSGFFVYDEKTTKEFARLYIEGNSMDMLYAMYDKVLVMRASKDYFSHQIKSVEHILGKFVDFGEYRKIQNDKTDTHILYLNFENKTEIMMLTMGYPSRTRQDTPQKTVIHGLLFAMVDKVSTPLKQRNIQTEKEIKEATFTEYNLKIGKEPYLLDAVLSIPDGEKQTYPVILFIGESTSGDMDATYDGVMMFKDIAEGLALNGIASLRYNQRVYQYADKKLEEDKEFTVEQELIDDAVSALKELSGNVKLDENQIYLIAHGFSSYYVPSILKESQVNAKALILLATSPLSQLDLNKTQSMNKFASLQGQALEDAIHQTLSDVELADKLHELTEEEAKNSKLFGRSAYYYWKQAEIKPEAYYRETEIPLLLLQGSEDAQIPVALGMSLWNKSLGKKERVSYKIYSGLDHYFSEGDMQPVHEDVALDIQSWLLNIQEGTAWN